MKLTSYSLLAVFLLFSLVGVQVIPAADWIYFDRSVDLSFFGIDPTWGLYAMDASGANPVTVANGFFFCPFFNAMDRSWLFPRCIPVYQ